jgi:hypothetical protein
MSEAMHFVARHRWHKSHQGHRCWSVPSPSRCFATPNCVFASSRDFRLGSSASFDASGGDFRYYPFAGSPVIFPLVYECETRDIVLVHLTPAERPEIPAGSPAIMNRMQEIGFNSALIREMRAVAFVTKLIDEGRLADGKRC